MVINGQAVINGQGAINSGRVINGIEQGGSPPDAPTLLTAVQNGNGNVDLAWMDIATNETGYKVYRSADGVSYAEIADIAADSTSYSDATVNIVGLYYYYVAAYNTAGEANSNADSVTLSFQDDFNRSNGAIGGFWTGSTWTIATHRAINTPSEGANIAINGTFDSDMAWTKGAGWSIAAGKATAVGASSALSQAQMVAGIWYVFRYTVSNLTLGLHIPTLAGLNGPSDGSGFSSSNGIKQAIGRAGANVTYAVTGSTLSADVDDVTVKPLTKETLIAVLPSSEVDVAAQAAVYHATGHAGVFVNLDNAANPQNFVVGYLVRQAGSYICRLEKVVAGTYTQLISAAVTHVSGAVVQVRKSGTTYQLFYNGTQVGTDQTVSDIGVVNNTIHGLFATGTSTVDNFALEMPPF